VQACIHNRLLPRCRLFCCGVPSRVCLCFLRFFFSFFLLGVRGNGRTHALLQKHRINQQQTAKHASPVTSPPPSIIHFVEGLFWIIHLLVM
jgi:hypothetical protein